MDCVKTGFVFAGLVLFAYVQGQTTTAPLRKCRAINEWAGQPDMDTWCTEQCAIDHCPEYACNCDPPTTTSTQPVTTPTHPKSTPIEPTSTPTRRNTTPIQPATTPSAMTSQLWTNCKAVNLWTGYEILDRWCAINCPKGYCPDTSCKCFNQSATKQTTPTLVTSSSATPSRGTASQLVVTTSVAPPTTLSIMKVCKAISIWKDIDVFDHWCMINCARGEDYCPSNTCKCNIPLVVPGSTRSTHLSTSTTFSNKISTTTTTKPTLSSSMSSTQKPTTTSTMSTTTSTYATQTPAPMGLVSSANYKRCSSNGVLAGDYWHAWCQKQCDKNECTIEYCNC